MFANATQGRYSIRSAAPELAVMQATWIALVAIGSLTHVAAGAICLEVLTSRKARSSPFNLYLVGLVLPDRSSACPLRPQTCSTFGAAA
jgi:hypothetical protein